MSGDILVISVASPQGANGGNLRSCTGAQVQGYARHCSVAGNVEETLPATLPVSPRVPSPAVTRASFLHAGDRRVSGQAADAQRDLQLVPGHVRVLPPQRRHMEGRAALPSGGTGLNGVGQSQSVIVRSQSCINSLSPAQSGRGPESSSPIHFGSKYCWSRMHPLTHGGTLPSLASPWV